MDEDIDESEVVVTNVYGDVCLRKARRKRQKVLVKEMLHDYANNTTLHGLGYTTKRGLNIFEKVFWLITFVASLCMCSYLIHNVWLKWKTSPVIVTVNEKLIPVRTVPFPSVLICPQSKLKATVYNYTAINKKMVDELFEDLENETRRADTVKYEDVTHICGRYNIITTSLNMLDRTNSDTTLVKNILDVAPNISDIFELCILMGQDHYDCEKIVSKTLTSEGLCYSINSLAADDILRKESIRDNFPYLEASTPMKNWSMEYGYNHYGPETYPVPGKENGASPDLEIILKEVKEDRDPTCNIVNSGFKVYIQHPADLPQSSLYYFAVMNNQVSSMALSFSTLDTSEALKKYNPDVRQCYFAKERPLKYFKIYTSNNCKIECLTNKTFEICKCVGFYMPHETKTQICTFQKTTCMEEARDEVVKQESNNTSRICSCLPPCNSVDYEAEILKTDFNFKDLMKALYKMYNTSLDDNGTQYSKLEIYFKRSQFVSMHRSELFGVTDFLANIGGLLGLFLGFSFLSLVELFYFITVRLFFALKKDLKEEKKTLQRQSTIIRKDVF